MPTPQVIKSRFKGFVRSLASGTLLASNFSTTDLNLTKEIASCFSPTLCAHRFAPEDEEK